MDNGIMAMSMTSSGLARMPSQAEKIIEKPTSKPINNASKKAINNRASTLFLLVAGRFAAHDPGNKPDADVEQHHHARDEDAGGGYSGAEYGAQKLLILADHHQAPTSRHQNNEQYDQQRIERQFQYMSDLRRKVGIDQVDTDIDHRTYRDGETDEGQPDQCDAGVLVWRRNAGIDEVTIDELQGNDEDQRHHQGDDRPLDHDIEQA